MPLPKIVARINRSLTNRGTGLFAGRVPPFAIVVHTGRRSGNEYRTPIMAFPSGNEVVIALTYGDNTDWVRNVLAAGHCSIVYGREAIRMNDPRHVLGPERRDRLPRVVRLALRLLRVDKFLVLARSAADG